LILDDTVIDADLAESYTVLRSSGQFVAGGWTDTKTTIAAFGVVSVARPKDLEMLPEGDRPLEARVFYAQQPLYVTRDNPQDGTGTSDVLIWQSVYYRVLTVFDYSNRGYWKVIAARTLGS
jgi:hypothetical protein